MTSPQRDSTNEAVRTALRRALAAGGSIRVYAAAGRAGLFTSRSAAAQRTLDSLLAEGWVDLDDDGDRSTVRLTAQGRAWILDHDQPRLLLEDLLRAAESQAGQLEQLVESWRQLERQLTDQAASVRAILTRLPGESSGEALPHRVEHLLHEVGVQAGADQCLATLYQNLVATQPTLTIGQFHDALRALRDAGRINLTPWTGPLYQLPEPALALLIGHEVLYYARLRRRDAA